MTDRKIIQGLIDKEKYLYSVSGGFLVDADGVVQRFEPSNGNLPKDEVTTLSGNYIYETRKSVRTLVIPEGVKGFASDFMRETKVTERFLLPEGLLRIGNNGHGIGDGEHCVFANCILPTVAIPPSVRTLGNYAFGHTHIKTLQLPASLRSPYGRQFKDSHIGTLRLPREWRDFVSLADNGRLRVTEDLSTDSFGYLRLPSTRIEKLEFYQ